MSTSVFQEWLNSNAHRAYPFREDTVLSPVGALAVTLPNYVFVDLVLAVGGDPSVSVQLGQLSFAGNFLSAVFVDGSGNTVTSVAVNLATHLPNAYYALTGVGDYSDARGKVVLGNLSALRSDLPEGAYSFALGSAQLEPSVVRPDIRGVRSLQVGTTNAASNLLYGNIRLVAGPSIQLTYLGSNQIRIDALGTPNFNEPAACDESYSPPVPVSTINGIPAANVKIVGDGKCVDVSVSGNVITIADTCSQPCCGCSELEFLTQRIELLQTVLKNTETYAAVLNDRITNLIDAMLAAKAGG